MLPTNATHEPALAKLTTRRKLITGLTIYVLAFAAALSHVPALVGSLS